jgi:hypothetical protein
MRHDNSIKHGNYVKFGKHNFVTDVQQKSGLKLNLCKSKSIVWEHRLGADLSTVCCQYV